ncbi:MAG: hypothetical protein HOH48_08840 [Candidatus Puniceispirillum sp.]|jgi:hypothetical protein|uniref:hypothetical protein n=1 Tax=Candidatus Puniceispirillum sp. TaxID=2026719 RepID=UPI001ECBD76B|nr:hypothetical protein [Candidatus Puniceispirillum sp.]MBT6415199.1 hypothetical protein [Candidatus Puniceispirillum sp.]MBT6566842.1 hypothetical protein [Candidatus Puniceispirillum sp.]
MKRAIFVPLMATFLVTGLASTAFAVGKTYVPKKESKELPKMEVCRLMKVERDPEEGTKCIYQRQSRGQPAQISNDSPNAACQKSFQCKRE